jgi:hypothetical protein
MMLLHGLLLVFSLITIAPLLIVFSMALPSPPSAEDEPEPTIETVSVRLHRSQELEKIHACQLNPSPFRR